MTEVRKIGGWMTMSRQSLLDHGLVQPTPAEQRERDAWRAVYEERKQAATGALPVFVAQLAAVTDPVARVVLDLHKADDGRCDGCEYGGYEAERPEWPCSTTEAVATALGITVPPDLDMAEWG